MQVRKLIIENKMHQAFQLLEPVVPTATKNDLHLLWSQFVYWEEQKVSGNNPSMVERNRIVYGILQIVSELEGNAILKQMEVNLMTDYAQLGTVEKMGNIDQIMLWLLTEYPNEFRNRLQHEKSPMPPPLDLFLTDKVLGAYIKANNLAISTDYLFQYIHGKSQETTQFFTQWLQYNNKRSEVAKAIHHKIQYNEKKYYKKLLLMGVLVGVAGAAIMAFFGDDIELIADDLGDLDDE